MTSLAIVIPARYGSTRFEGKPLALLNNVPMIRHVYEQCRKAAKVLNADVFVLTDDNRISDVLESKHVWLDKREYANGTERCAGFAKSKVGKKYETFINVQGDMPDVTLDMIEKVNWHLQHYPITTVWTEMPTEKQYDPNTVKMITAGDQCLWFGRGITGYGYWHLGIYGYKRNPLEFYSTLEVTEEEKIEQLEQLRWLKNGWQIGCLNVQYNGVEINSPEDVKEWHNNKHSQ